MLHLTKKLARNLGAIALTSVVAWSITGSAQASLIGDNVRLQLTANAGFSFDQTAGVVDPGTEFNMFGLDVDLAAATIRIDNPTIATVPFPTNGGEQIIFSSLDWVNDPTGIITGLVLVDFDLALHAGNAVAFSDANLSFTDHSVTIAIAGYDFDPSSYIDILIETNHAPVPLRQPPACSVSVCWHLAPPRNVAAARRFYVVRVPSHQSF